MSLSFVPEEKNEANPVIRRSDLIFGETLTGTINGSNATFSTANNFVPGSVDVFVNGLKQKRVTHFNTTGVTTIIFSDSPQVGDILVANYERA